MPQERKPANIPVDGSWRMIDGDENDSFDTTVVRNHYDDDPLLSSNPSQLSSSDSQGASFGSQDSYSGGRADEDILIKRMSFTPSIASASTGNDYLDRDATPVPQFLMPKVDVQSPSRRATRSARAAQASPSEESYFSRRAVTRRDTPEPKAYRRPKYGRHDQYNRHDDYDSLHRPATMSERFSSSVPEFLFNTAAWFCSIVGIALQMAKWPLALMLLVYILIGAGITTKNLVLGNMSSLPICHLPFISIPFCNSRQEARGGDGSSVAEFDLKKLVSAQDGFEKVLETSAEGVSLPMEMKRSEATVRDLRTMVKYSDLASRDELVFELDGYVDGLRAISGDLQTFNTHVGSAVDSVISINRWTSRYIDTVAAHQTELNSRGTARIGLDWLFSPFQPTVFDERQLVDQYVEHTALVSDKIAALILEAQATLRTLAQAEGHLQVIQEAVVRDGKDVREQKSDVFWTLWTLVGANKRKLHNLSSQLSLLNQVEAQRSSAVAQLMGLVHDLGDIQAKLGDLRDRVAAPELLIGDDYGGKGAGANIPLTVHIETINAGVERLEAARGRIKAEENDKLHRAIARSREEDRLIDG